MNQPKRQLKKSPAHGSQARLAKHVHGSLESRDENTRQNYPLKKSRDKPVKQPSTAMLRPTNEPKKSQMMTACQTNGRRSAANVRQVEFSLVEATADYREVYFNTLNEKQLQNAKAIGKSYSQKQFQNEPQDRPRTLQDETAVANSTSTQSIIFLNSGGNSKVLKCHYHPLKDAKYLVELNHAEDILCCPQCAPNLKARGLQLEDLNSFKSKRNYELDEFLQRSLQSIETLRKCLGHLPEYQHQLTMELTQQMNVHDNYYQHLIDLIQQRKDESQQVLIKSMNALTDYFNGLHRQLHEHLNQLEESYNDIIVKREDIKLMNEIDFQRILTSETARLTIPKLLTAPQIEIWKVEIGDPTQFEKDLENYIVRIDQSTTAATEKTSHTNSLQSVMESCEQFPSEQQSALLCEEEFEWGYKPKPAPINKDKDIYFSFEKKNSESSVGSPAFKQI